MKLILIRHGLTEWNAAGKEMGQSDSPLTEIGQWEAQAAAVRVQREGPTQIVCSDLGRAVTTAAIIAQECKIAVAKEPLLRERAMGIFEGMTGREAEARYPEEWYCHRVDPKFRVPNGESSIDRFRRGKRFLDKIAQSAGVVVAVSHKGLILGIIEAALKRTPTTCRVGNCPHGSYTSMEYEAGSWTIQQLPCSNHLNGLDFAP